MIGVECSIFLSSAKKNGIYLTCDHSAFQSANMHFIDPLTIEFFFYFSSLTTFNWFNFEIGMYEIILEESKKNRSINYKNKQVLTLSEKKKYFRA